MLKILLIPPNSNWSIEVGNKNRWDRYFYKIPHKSEIYSIVNDVNKADFIINIECEYSGNWKINSILNPLTKNDVETFVWDSFDRPTGKKSGFYCSLPKYLFDRRRHAAISYPGPYNELIEDFAREDAFLNFSFLGQMSAGVRVRLVEHFREREKECNAVVRETGDMEWEGKITTHCQTEEETMRIEFVNLLRRSKFVLCPRGFGTGSFRLFETMQAGRVPVIISDSYVKPEGIDWDSCSLTIPENRISDIPSLIESRLDDWEFLATNARAAWEANFSPQRVMDNIAINLMRMSENISQNSFSPWIHGGRVIVAVFQDHLRPIAGRMKRWFRKH